MANLYEQVTPPFLNIGSGIDLGKYTIKLKYTDSTGHDDNDYVIVNIQNLCTPNDCPGCPLDGELD